MEEKTAGRSNQEWLDETYDKLLVKMKAECARIGTKIPYTTDKDGTYHDITETPWGKMLTAVRMSDSGRTVSGRECFGRCMKLPETRTIKRLL